MVVLINKYLYNSKAKAKGYLLFVVLSLIVSLVSIYTLDKIALSALCILQFVLFSIGLFRRGFKVFSFAFIFSLLLFIFHCSYCVLWVFGYEWQEAVIKLIDDETWKETIRFCIWFFFFFSVGLHLSVKQKEKVSLKASWYNSFSLSECKNIGLVITALCIIPRFYVDVRRIAAFFSGGYLSTFNVSINGFIDTLAAGFFIGLLIMMVGFKNQPRALRLIAAIGLFVSLIGMLSGRRQEKVVFIVAIFLMFFSCCYKKQTPLYKKIIACIGVYLFLAAIATFGDVRRLQDVSIGTFISEFGKNISYKLLFDQLSEFGYSGYTLAASVKCFPEIGYNYGMNYVTTWIQIFPNVGGMYSSLNVDISFVSKIPSEYYYYLGGSLLGEAFYNFGYFSYIFFIIIGFISGRISQNITFGLYRNNIPLRTIVGIICMPLFFLWVRGDFAYIPRTLIWFVIAVVALKQVRLSFFAPSYNDLGIVTHDKKRGING